MRILHIEKFLFAPGGVASYVRALSRLQRLAGHEVDFFGCTGPGESRPDRPTHFDFATTRNPLAVARMVHNDRAAELLRRFLRRRGPFDVAHLHNIYHHLTPSILPVLARRRVAMVISLHDYRLACPTRHFFRADGPCMRCLPNRFHHAIARRCAGCRGVALAVESFVQRLLRRYFSLIDVFLCPTRFMADVMRKAGAGAGKTAVVPNVTRMPDLPPVSPGAELLFAGRISHEKGPDVMLDLARRMPQTPITIAGDGEMLPALRDHARRDGLDNVTLPGHVGSDRLDALLARATAVVLTSRALENSPQIMLEAMAAGRCVIAPDQPPLRECLRDGATGRTFAPNDVDSLERVARAVLADPAGAARLGAAAAAMVRRKHDPDTLVETIDQLYDEARDRCVLRW